jgi:DNA-binding transcriptional MocR family regulator
MAPYAYQSTNNGLELAAVLPLPTVADALGNWSSRRGPLYRRLADAIEDAIEDGRLQVGTMLPPERQLATALTVSRSTVVAAFEALKRSGRLEARQGSGTWVRGHARPPDEGNRELVEALEDHAILRDLSGAPTQTVEFTAAAVDCAPEVVDAMTSVTRDEATKWSSGHGYSPQGYEELRSIIAQRLTDMGLDTNAAQVLITTGATQAVLLAARLYLEPGAPAVLETPSYAGAIDVLHAAGARLLSIDIDASGARTDQLGELMARSLPRLVYLVPDFHNPAGLVLSERRRREVAQLAAEFHVPVIEDLVQRELWLDTPPPPPIATFNPEAPILTIGSMSKVFWGGLRVGWIRGSETTVARLARLKAVDDFGTPAFSQLVSSKLLPHIDATAQWRREELRTRFAVLEAAVARHLPQWRCDRPAGGLSAWAQLPTPRAEELVRRADAFGVALVPGSTFAVDHHRHADRIRLPFVAAPEVIEEGVRRLAEAWADLEERVSTPAPHSVVV